MAEEHVSPQHKRELEEQLRALIGIANRTRPGQVTHQLAEIMVFVETIVTAAYEQGKSDQRDEMEEQLPL